MTTVVRPIRFTTRSRRKCAVTTPDAPSSAEPAVGRVPRVARLMALAIRFDRLLRDGRVASQSELARLARVTQPRMTQIMNLLHLAPDIQEEILFLPPVTEGRDPVHEHMLREVAACADWREQRRRRREIRARS
ncbi:MAG: hypothetical protein ACF8R9_02545 [Phycisphaerales bacterium JB054]